MKNISLISIILILVFIKNGKADDLFLLPKVNQEKIPLSLSVSRFETGFNDSPEALIIEKGSFSKKHRSSHSAFIIKRPEGNFLIDTGLGSNIDNQFKSFDWLLKPLFKYEKQKTIKDLIKNEKVNGIFLTHLHWDHATGITDFPKAKVYIDKLEKKSALNIKDKYEKGYLKSQFDSNKINWQEIVLDNKRYGPFEKSLDIFEDGSFIAVRLPGHTKGSLGYILNLKSGARMFFIGDTVWSIKQIDQVKHKFLLAKMLTDNNPKDLIKTILKINKLKKNNQKIRIIPAHDYSHIKEIIPLYPKFIK